MDCANKKIANHLRSFAQMTPRADALQLVLKQELPSIDFHSETVEYLFGALKSDEVTGDEVCEAVGPFLYSHGVVSDDDAKREVCHKIFKRLQGDGFWSRESDAVGISGMPIGDKIRQRKAQAQQVHAEQSQLSGEVVVGLDAWLEKLQLTTYRVKANAWCKDKGIVDVEEIIENAEDFSQALGLKTLQQRRVMKARKDKSMQETAHESVATDEQSGHKGPRPPPVLRVQSIKDIGDPKNPYQLVEKIGQGVSAAVYKAVRFEDGDFKDYAVKAVSLAKLKLHGDFSGMIVKLKQETSILFTLRHKNIVSLYDVIEEKDSILYLVMELSGGDLHSHIVKNERMLEDDARVVFVQLVDALKHIHAKGIVHRDIKPENILIHKSTSTHLHVKITDFGQSKLVDDGYTMAKTTVGTREYWAPEVFGSTCYDEKADLWSLGVVLYVMLEGTYPFDDHGKTMEEQIRNAEVEFKTPNRPSKQAQEIITGLIKVSPQDRLTLKQLSEMPWFQHDSHGNGALGNEMHMVTESGVLRERGWEETIRLPRDPQHVKQFRAALQQFTLKFKHGATLSGKKKVSVTWRTDDKAARDELYRLLSDCFPGHSFLDGGPT